MVDDSTVMHLTVQIKELVKEVKRLNDWLDEHDWPLEKEEP